ncbi:MAG: asparagine--tRNA ligase [Deltaproteobacteria bacterium]|nr:asparagine--tRNA ligase [Deltaproteobacteria bacterium]
MKPEARIGEIAKFEGKEVTLCGWVYNIRSSGKIHFLLLRDGSGVIQCVAGAKDVSPGTFEAMKSLTQESSVIVTGSVRAEKRAPHCGFELTLKDVKILQIAKDYPISPKEHGPAFLLDNRHLWLRSLRQVAIMKVRNTIIRAIRDFFDQNGFLLIDSPIFTPAACEGTSTLFETNYFETKAYLTQSGQLYNEATAMAFGKVYCFGPTFRAEKSKTRRHLTEFWMVEPEMAFYDLGDTMDVCEDFLCFVVSRVLERNRADLDVLERPAGPLENVRKPFPRITHAEAIAVLRKAGAEIADNADFGGDEETILTKQFDRPIMVHRYPAEVKAFYMKGDPADRSKALCVDVLAPEGYGEVIGGGQREDDLDTLVAAIKKHGLPEEAFTWYLDLRRYGSVPHSGFGLGVERTVAWLCGLHHVRETIPFPRMMERVTP